MNYSTAGAVNIRLFTMNKFSTATLSAALPVIFLSSYSASVNAADAVKLASEGGLELSITANRRPLSIDKTLASVSVITREAIEKSNAHDVLDLLQLQRGISLSRNGGSGSSTSVFIRGAESDQALVLLDGVRISSATTGAFNWAKMPLDQVERIEIVRGPRAALYGSDAIGGVIEISTRKNTSPYVNFRVGKYATKGLSAGFSDGDGKQHVSANISLEKSDSFSATNDKAGQFTYDPDKDGYEKNSVSLSFSSQLSERSKAGVQLFHSTNNVAYDKGKSNTELETISANLQSDLSSRWTQKLTLSQTNDDVLSQSSYGESPYKTRRKTFDWQNTLSLSANTTAIIGAAYRQDRGQSKDFDKKVNNKALYANINNKRGALNLDLSLRYDKHSKSGNKTTGQLAAGYNLSPRTTLFASAGTAFKAPNINELYYPGFGGRYAGNPDLKPEKSRTFEVGLKTQLSDNQRIEASLFHTKVKDLISYTGDNNQAINNEKVTLKGLEIGYVANFGKLDLSLDASLLRTKNNTTGERLRRRPDSKVTLDLGYAISEKTRFGLDASLVGSRDDMNFSAFPAERVKLAKYSVLNLSASHQIAKHASLGLRVENLSNKDYELAYGYNTPKRGAYLTLKIQ